MYNLIFMIILWKIVEGVKPYVPPLYIPNQNLIRKRGCEEDIIECDDDALMSYLAEIQVMNPESIIKIGLNGDLRSQCKRVSKSLEKAANYLKRCEIPEQPDLFLQLFKGVQQLYYKLCTPSPYLDNFYKARDCLRELKNDYDDCDGPADWNECPDTKETCKVYKSVADCYYIKTATVCGMESADTMKELLMTILDEVVTAKCPDVATNPDVPNPMPEAYIKGKEDETAAKAHLSRRNDRLTITILAVISLYIHLQFLWN